MSGKLAQLCWIYSASFAQDLLHICNSGRNDEQEHLRTYVALTSNSYMLFIWALPIDGGLNFYPDLLAKLILASVWYPLFLTKPTVSKHSLCATSMVSMQLKATHTAHTT